MKSKLSILATIILFSLNSMAALMPYTDVLTVSIEDNKTVQAINVLDWIEKQKALISARNNFDLKDYVSLDKIHQGMSEADLGMNILFTTLKNMESATLENMKRTLKSVEGVASTEIVTEDKSEIKMNMDLTRAVAAIRYKGDVDAELTYSAGSSELHLELSKNIYGTRFLAEHTTKNDESKNLVGVRWNF